MLDTDCICADGEPVVDPPAVQKPSPPAAEDEKTAPLDETFDSLASSGVLSSRNVSIEIVNQDVGTPADAGKMISFADDVTNLSGGGNNNSSSSEEKKTDDEFAPEEDPLTAISVLEADYDVKPTELYSLIEKRQWDHALNLLNNLAKFAALTQASTWVVRKEPGTGKLRWRLLPLHAAIIFRGPLPVIEALVKAYPGAGRCRDDQGMTPAHLAFRNDAPDEVIDEVLGAYPAAIAVKDRKGREPLTCAMGSNCTKKSRARLLATYSSVAMAGERDRVVAELAARHEAERAVLQDRYDAASQEAAGAAGLAQELEESAARETILTEKVQDLTKALEAMTAMRQLEAKKHSDEASQWSAVEREVLKSLHQGPVDEDGADDVVAADAATDGETAATSASNKDVLRSSIDDLVASHRRLQAERDELAERNDVLESLLERTVAERDGVEAILSKLDQDMAAAQTVRERMVAAIAKQEAEVYGLAAREHDVMRGILERRELQKGGLLWMDGWMDGWMVYLTHIVVILRVTFFSHLLCFLLLLSLLSLVLPLPAYRSAERDEMEAVLRGDSLQDQEALRRTYSSNSLRGRGRSDMSELGLGGAEEGRTNTPSRSPRHDRSKSPYNRAATAGY